MSVVTITVYTSRDDWIRQEETLNLMYATSPSCSVIIDLRNEGISLKASGILQAINHWVESTNRDPNTVTIKTPNVFEKTPYHMIGWSHFFGPSQVKKYLVPWQPINTTSTVFAFFVGSHTEDRAKIAQDIYDLYLDKFLVSVMRNTFKNLTWDSHIWELGSVDNLTIQDQYESSMNTNLSLLKFYDQFQIELVAESMTRGDSFFPTEKTVRPIVGARPFITFGPVDFLKKLQIMGFQTFHTLWNEDYDQLEGPDRWTSMKQTIEQILRNGYDCKQAQDIVNYNYQHLEKMITNG